MIALEGGDSGVEADRSTITRDNRRISVQMQQQADRTFTEKGLTSVQAHLLLYILKHSEKGISLTEIHREFGYSMAALSSLVKRLKESVDMPIHLHTHNTTGTGDMVNLKAIEAGADIVDTALSPLGNGTSQTAP